VQLFIGEKGYLRPQIGEPELENVGKVGLPIPLLGRRGEGVKLKIPINEGPRYTFGKLKVEGNTLFNQEQVFAVTGLKTGEVASLKVIREGVYERLRKLYGRSGYIQATTDLRPEYNPDGTADFTITVDEGKPFRIGRIEFQGNTVTRDTVLRREILVNEGDLYNQELFDFSRLRLNQLGYFEEIKEEDAQFQTDERNGVVDITVRVKEKGRQQVSFTGGVSGAAGSFIGVSYATNNLFGYGESLSFDVQAGNRQRSFSVSFTEPYLRGRPISAGVSVFTSRLKFFSGGLGGSFFGNTGTNFADDRFDSSLFTRTSTGFSVNLNAPLSLFTKRNLNITRFTRIGLSYSFSSSSLMDPGVNRDADPNNDIFISFREPSITISSISPSIVYNTLNSPIDPTMGRSLSATFNFSGLGGDVKVFTPAIEVKYFRPVIRREKPQVLGMRIMFENSTSFGSSGKNNNSFFGGIPIFNRFFLGGEDTLRGYNVRSLSPVSRVDSFITVDNVQSIQELNNKVLPILKPGRRFRGVKEGTLRQFFFNNASNDIPGSVRFTPIGGDTQLLYNVEYRIPIVGPLTLALFLDAGSAFNLRGVSEDQIRTTNPGREIVGRDATLPFNPLFQGTSFILNPRGKIATPREIVQSRTPETPADQLPKGFRFVRFEGDVSRKTVIRLSNNDFGGFRRNFRSSVGGELRIQVPVVNVPFRLIYAYNPNSKTGNQPGQIFIEDKSLFRFSIGRTF
jgi:outer membrane protein insertion porin family